MDLLSIISEFEEAFAEYYGYKPEYKIDEKGIKVVTFRQRLQSSQLPALTAFYRYRLNTGRTAFHKINDSDFNYIDEAIQSVKMVRVTAAIALEIPHNSFSFYYRRYTNAKKSYEMVKTVEERTKPQEHSHNGETHSDIEWAKKLRISTVHFRQRRKEYGDCALIYMSREDYRANKHLHKKVISQATEEQKQAGTRAWQKLSNTEPSKHRLKTSDINPLAAASLISYMIEDAKSDVRLRSAYREQSELFLRNHRGYLEWLISGCNGINIEATLEHLEDFCMEHRKFAKEKH